MIHDFNKAVISMIVNKALLKGRNLWFYQNYGDKVIKAASESKVISIHAGSNKHFRQIGKTTMIIDIHSEIDKSIIIVGNTVSKQNMQSKLREKGISDKKVILISNKNNIEDIDIDAIRGCDENVVFLFDDSVSELTVQKIKKKYPNNYTFGFAFKKVVSLI